MITVLAIWNALTSPLGKALSAIVGVGVVLGGIYLFGHHEGRLSVLDRLKDDKITVLKDGQKIDSNVIGADDDALCTYLGGCS